MSLKGKVALVTGASRGIGQAIVLALGHAGATVYGTATSEKGAQDISAYLKAANILGSGKVLNVTDALSVDQLAASIEAPSILVNNAAVTRDGLFLRMSQEQWDEVILTNLSSVFRVSKAFIKPMLKSQWGRIINISSVVGVAGSAGQTNYAAAKAGVIGFTKSLAQELASRNITINVVAPGFIKTDMTEELPEDRRAAIMASIPLRKVGSVEDIANMVVYLASDQAAYITGQTMHVNGGMLMV